MKISNRLFNDQQINPKLKQYIIDNAKKNQTDNRQNFYFRRNTNNIEQPLPIVDTLNNSKYHDNKNFGKIKSIACGRNHSIIINDLGMVFTFGKYDNYRLGHQNVNNNLFSPKLITGTGSPKYGKIISSSAGYKHSLILNNYGNVFSFGNSNNGRLGIQVPPSTINKPQIIDNYNPLLEPIEPPEELDPEYIIRDNKLFKNFTIKINNLQNACLSAYFIYIKNIVTNDEIFIYNKEEDALNIYEIKISNNSETLRNLSLEITYNNKLELKLNNKTLGTGQFEIKFYNNNFDEIKEINIKTNEYNELINVFFRNKLNDQNIYNELNNNYYHNSHSHTVRVRVPCSTGTVRVRVRYEDGYLAVSRAL
mgnify:CR=1 FL=1